MNNKHNRMETTGRRLVLLPLPFQGHLSPMLQLGNILHSKGFSIIILHTHFNSPDPTNHPHFMFEPIPGTDDNIINSLSGLENLLRLLNYINKELVGPIRTCLEKLMLEDDDGVACLITDAHWFGTQAVADALKLPRIVHRTSSIASFRSFSSRRVPDQGIARLMLEDDHGVACLITDAHWFGTQAVADALKLPRIVHRTSSIASFRSFSSRRLSDQEIKSESSILSPKSIEVKDLQEFVNNNPEGKQKMIELMVQGIKQARALIWNTFKELEEHELEALSQDFPNPHFLIGPFHKYFSGSSTSLLEQDQTSLSWLDKHPPNSVLYVSFGSIVKVNKSQFLEIAWGLANSMQPFLWVIRPGSIEGSEWLEPLPDGFWERIVKGRGHIVKWAPQHGVLAHRATGGFWTHSGWNSTFESICEGVPIICSPFFGDQLSNARYVSDVWKIGVRLENQFEREEIESAIKKVMVDGEGLEFRNEITHMKGKIDRCLQEGGSSYSSLEDLVNYILSF